MAKVIISITLEKEIKKRFNQKEAMEIANLMYSLEKNPKKGKYLSDVGGIVIKEIKYKFFRFYFLADGFKLKYLPLEELTDLLLKFVRMSDKKHQQETINEIKNILINIGSKGLE
jgi:hypothetical protein